MRPRRFSPIAAIALLLPACSKCGSTGTDDAGSSRTQVNDLLESDAGSPVVSFAAIGDVGKGNAGQRAVAKGLAKKCERDGCDFVVMLGDNIYESGASSPDDPIFRTAFEVPYAAVPAPFYVALGNHDYGAGGLGTDFERGAHEVAYSSRSAKWRLPNPYYRHRKEHVELFVMDTNLQLFGKAESQRREIGEWLSSSDATWKVMVGHHPYFSNGPHGDAGVYNGRMKPPSASGEPVKRFADDVWCGRADLSLSGHDHSRQWLEETCKGTELVVSGAGAETTTLNTNHKPKFQRLALGFHYLRFQGRRATIQFVDENGEVEYSRAFTK